MFNKPCQYNQPFQLQSSRAQDPPYSPIISQKAKEFRKYSKRVWAYGAPATGSPFLNLSITEFPSFKKIREKYSNCRK
jgi:hypothetical protein